MRKQTKSNKSIDQRIAFYTKKVIDYSAIHPAMKRPRRHTYRLDRLICYQKALRELIGQEGGGWYDRAR